MKQLTLHKTELLKPLPETMTVCATIDESGAEHEITELMIRRACEKMDADQLWPYASQAFCSRTRSSAGWWCENTSFQVPNHQLRPASCLT